MKKGVKKIPPVLVVSGYSDPEIVDFAMSLGAQAFFPKPINDQQFLNAVHKRVH